MRRPRPLETGPRDTLRAERNDTRPRYCTTESLECRVSPSLRIRSSSPLAAGEASPASFRGFAAYRDGFEHPRIPVFGQAGLCERANRARWRRHRRSPVLSEGQAHGRSVTRLRGVNLSGSHRPREVVSEDALKALARVVYDHRSGSRSRGRTLCIAITNRIVPVCTI